MHATERARHTLLGGALVAIAGLLAALALVYSNASGVAEVANEAQRQQQIESALGAAASARNALGQTILLIGSTDDPVLAGAAISETEQVIAALEERIDALEAESPGPGRLQSLAAEATATTRSALDSAAAGDLETASRIAADDVPAAFDGLIEELTSQRALLAGSIARAAAESGRVATASRFMVAFFVPMVAVVIAFTVAKRRRKREDLARELEQERTLNKSKDQLIANLSHELRTPLTGIYTSALTIEDVGFGEPELAMELTDVIIDQSADLTRMVEDLLVSAQADAGRLRFDLRPTPVTDVTDALAREFARFDADVTWDIQPASVMIDTGRLRQLLRNLVSNAAKYGDGQVTIRGYQAEPRYVIEVADNGPGVPPDVEERMFQRFVHRGDQPLIVGSVGLGLSITKVLAEGMNGLIVYHRRDHETVFEVTLELEPTAASEALPPDPAPHQAPALLDDAEQPSITDLGLDVHIQETLTEAGIDTVDAVSALTTAELELIPGIGPQRAQLIEQALARS